jgi:hypothetical protein
MLDLDYDVEFDGQLAKISNVKIIGDPLSKLDLRVQLYKNYRLLDVDIKLTFG